MDNLELFSLFVSVAMSIFERRADFGRNDSGKIDAETRVAIAGATQNRPKVPAFHELHRDEVASVDFSQIKNLRDVWMGERSDYLRFGDEHLDEFRIVRQMREDTFHRDDLLESLDAFSLGPENLRHPTRGNAVEQNIFPVGRAFVAL